MLTSIRGLAAATLLAACGLAASPALADETAPPGDFTVSASVAVVSQYRFRGISQSDNKAAVQGSIALSHKSGFYVGVWSSSTSGDLARTPVAPGGSEIDVYGGYSHTFSGPDVTLDLGVYGYLYPQATINNYYEVYGSLSKTLGPVTAKAGINYAPGQAYFRDYGVTDHNVYVYGELSSGIPNTPVSLHARLGYTDGGLRYIKNYMDYSIGAAVKWRMLTLDASLVGTNVSRGDVDRLVGCASASACEAYWHRPAKTTAVVSLTASF